MNKIEIMSLLCESPQMEILGLLQQASKASSDAAEFKVLVTAALLDLSLPPGREEMIRDWLDIPLD